MAFRVGVLGKLILLAAAVLAAGGVDDCSDVSGTASSQAQTRVPQTISVPQAVIPLSALPALPERVFTLQQQSAESVTQQVQQQVEQELTEPEPSPISVPKTSSSVSSKVTSSSASQKPSLAQLRTMAVEELKKLNADVYGKIIVPGCKIQEPVVLVDDILKYLRYDFYGNYLREGTIHADPQTSWTTLDFNTVITGHNRGKSKPATKMFGSLPFYRDAEFCKNNPYIYLENLYGSFKYEVFTVFVHSDLVTAEEYDYNFMRTDYDTFEKKDYCLKTLKDKSLFDTGVQVDGNDKVITLVTCVYDFEGAKLVIMGKLVESSYK